MAMGKRRATPFSVATARRLERQFDQVQPGCCPKSITQRAVGTCECGTAHGFAERVETPGRHSATSRPGSRCCDYRNGVNGGLGYSSLFRAHILGHGLGAWLAMVRNLMDDEVATDDVEDRAGSEWRAVHRPTDGIRAVGTCPRDRVPVGAMRSGRRSSVKPNGFRAN